MFKKILYECCSSCKKNIENMNIEKSNLSKLKTADDNIESTNQVKNGQPGSKLNHVFHEDKRQAGKEEIEIKEETVDNTCCNFLARYGACFKCILFWGNTCGCPTTKTFKIGSIRVVARITMCVLLWGFVYAVTFPPCAIHYDLGNATEAANDAEEEECVIPGLPGGNIFGILMIFIFGMIAEALIVLIPMPCGLPALPPLLGSLLVGILFRNVPGIAVAKYIDDLWSSRLRNMALGVILGRAGLEVDKHQMYKLRWVVPRLAFLPCIIEACSYGVVAHFILDLPWMWSFMLGFVCGAVAPACVVPSMIEFQEKGYGAIHGVPSLCIAAASIDDVVAINVFNILLTVTFDTSGLGHSIGIAFAEIIAGLAFGLIGGFYLQKIPDRRQHNIIRDRTFLLVIFSFFLIFITDGPIDLAGAGTLGTLTASFVAAVGWKEEPTERVAHNFKALWFFFQPLLFGLTGATVDFSTIDPHTVAYGYICIFICLTIRLTVAGNSVSRLGWSHKEKLMTAISWIPKATVQAAIGGSALSRVILVCSDVDFSQPPCDDFNNSTETECIDPNSDCYLQYGYANTILTIAVLLILTTAPIGVFLIGIFGPKLLPHDFEKDTEDGAVDLEGAVKKCPTQSSFESGVWSDSECTKTGLENHAYVNDSTAAITTNEHTKL